MESSAASLASLTALDCVDWLRSIVVATFPEDRSLLHPMSAAGARSDRSLNESRQILAHLKNITASGEHRSDRNLGLRTERAKLERQLRDLKEVISNSAKKLQSVVDKEALVDQRYLPMTLSSIQKICEEIGCLSCDIDQTPSAANRNNLRTFTIVIGSEGEPACFALEAVIITDPGDSAIMVESVSTTFQFGETEWSSDQVNQDIRSVIEKYDPAKFRQKLSTLVGLENLINTYPEREDLITIRDRVRSVFCDDAIDFFEGPGTELVQIPFNLLSSEPSFNYTFRFFNAFIVDSNLKYHFKIEPDLPILFSSAAGLYGHQSKQPEVHSDKFPSLLNVLIGPNVRDTFYSYVQSCQVSSRLPDGLLPERAIQISDLVFGGECFANLTSTVSILRRQVVFNCLFKSCFFHDHKLEYHRIQTSPISLEVYEADPVQGRLRILAKKPGYRDLSYAVSIGSSGELTLTYQDQPDESFATKFATIISKSLSIPVTTYFMYPGWGL